MFIVVLVVLIAPVLLQAHLANCDRFLTIRDLDADHRKSGLPFLFHGGMWSDVFLFAPLMAYLVSTYGSEWTLWSIYAAIVGGVWLSFIVHFFLYVPSGRKLPEAHTHDGEVTAAGWVHLVYMGVGFAFIALFYMTTTHAAVHDVLITSGLLFLHTVMGTHIPLKLWASINRPSWYPPGPVIDMSTATTLAIVILVLVGLTNRAIHS